MKRCSNCGGDLTFTTPPNDDRPRFFCPACGAIHYENPKMVVGSIPEHEGRILLCRRAIEPRLGTWTLPAGYLENGETVNACAEREAYEEARARLVELTPYLLFNICHIHQIYLMFSRPAGGSEFFRGQRKPRCPAFQRNGNPLERTVLYRDYRNPSALFSGPGIRADFPSAFLTFRKRRRLTAGHGKADLRFQASFSLTARFFPVRLAAYRALSARSINASTVSSFRSSLTPILTVKPIRSSGREGSIRNCLPDSKLAEGSVPVSVLF